MTLFPRGFHPHGRSETRLVEVFTAGKPIVFTLHGYQRAIHEIVHGHVDRFHIRGRGLENPSGAVKGFVRADLPLQNKKLPRNHRSTYHVDANAHEAGPLPELP